MSSTRFQCSVVPSHGRGLSGRPGTGLLTAPLLREDGEGEWQDWLVDDSPNQEARLADSQELGQRKHMLAQALKTLTDRERHIIVERRLVDEPKTLEDLSAKYGISRERVRQIEVRAFDKLQKAMKNMVVDAANESSRKAVEHAAAR